MIKQAKIIGADAVKFQMLNFEEQYHKKDYSLKFKKYFKKLEFNNSWFLELKKYSKKKKIIFFASPTYKEAAKILVKKNELIKIASPQFATDIKLTDYIIKSKKTCIVSNGLLNLKDTEKKITNYYKFNKNIILLYCISRYPTKISDLNLSNIRYLSKKLPCPIGFSDHTTSIDVPLYAIAMGAKVIEKHITLNNKLNGPDHKYALELNKFKKMIFKIREFEKSMGSEGKNLNKDDKRIIKEYTPKLITNTFIKKNTKLNEKMFNLKRSKSGIKFSKNLNKFKTIINLENNSVLNKKHIRKI